MPLFIYFSYKFLSVGFYRPASFLISFTAITTTMASAISIIGRPSISLQPFHAAQLDYAL